MANLIVTIVIRFTQDGKRTWKPATGKSDPQGSYYIRYCQGSKPRYAKAGKNYAEAEMAQMRMERKLKAAAQGFVVPEEVADTKKLHVATHAIAAYLADLRLNRRPEKSVKSKKSELEEFATFWGGRNVEEIKRTDLIHYRNHLLDCGKAPVTVLNKLMSVTTWLKKNPIISVTGLLKAEDWPSKPVTEPKPYTEAEQAAMMETATPDERLLLRFFLGTGMREGEVRHAEWSDLDWSRGTIRVQGKPAYNWIPKTNAGTRTIPLGDALLADLKEHCSKGLLFPNPNTGRPEGHFLRIIKVIAKRAGVQGAGCHRFRDTFATTQVRARELDLITLSRHMGHTNLEMMRLYAAHADLESPESRRAANASDKFASKPQLVKAG